MLKSQDLYLDSCLNLAGVENWNNNLKMEEELSNSEEHRCAKTSNATTATPGGK